MSQLFFTENSSWRLSPKVLIGVAFVLASIAIFQIATYHGIGILPDSTRYMRLVETPYDAPLYTWLLDAFRLTDVSVVAGAELLGLVLLVANTLLVWLILANATSAVAAALGTALIITSPQFVGFHTVAMSEPLFIGLVLVTAVLLGTYFSRRTTDLLILTGLALGLAMLARFTGAAMALAIAACLLLDQRETILRRLFNIAVVAVVSGVIFFAWAIASQMARGQSVGRDLRLVGNPTAETWIGGFNTLIFLLVPEQAPPLPRLVLFAGLVLLCGVAVWIYGRRVLAARGDEASALDWLPLVLGLFAVFYVLFMVAAVHIEANLPFNGRYALPLYVAVVVAATIALGGRHAPRLPRFGLPVLVLALGVVLASHVVRSGDRIWRSYAEGIGYDATAWHASPLVRFVKHLPANAVVYSNGADALSYLTGRFVRFVPWRFDRRTGRPAAVDTEISAVREIARKKDVYVVFADAINWRFYALRENELVRALPLRLIERFPDGRVYGERPPSRG